MQKRVSCVGSGEKRDDALFCHHLCKLWAELIRSTASMQRITCEKQIKGLDLLINLHTDRFLLHSIINCGFVNEVEEASL